MCVNLVQIKRQERLLPDQHQNTNNLHCYLPAWQCTVKQMNSHVDKHKIFAPPTHFPWRLSSKAIVRGERYPQMSLCVLTPVLTSMHSIIQMENSVNLRFLTAGLLKRLYFRCLLFDPIFQSELTIFPDRTLFPSYDISICLWFHKILWVLLPILCVSYFPFCWVCYSPFCGCYCPPCVSVTVHPLCQLLPILCLLLLILWGLLLPILSVLFLSTLCVCYCQFFVSVTVHSFCLLLPILRGLLLSII
jgi:hypothetical protein